jgi:hypothetical protein
MIVFGVFALLVAWIGFQLGTHRHTGILRTLGQRQARSQRSIDVCQCATKDCKRDVRPAALLISRTTNTIVACVDRQAALYNGQADCALWRRLHGGVGYRKL